MSSILAKRTRLFRSVKIDGITYSVFEGSSNKLAGNRNLVDLRTFMPIVHGKKDNPWSQANCYLLDPQSGEVFSTADGSFKVMMGTNDPQLWRSQPMAVVRSLPRLHPSRIMNFKGLRYSRKQIMDSFTRYYETHRTSAKGGTSDLFEIDLEVAINDPSIAHFSRKAQPVVHRNHGRVLKGNAMIGKVVLVNGQETVEFSANPKIHTDTQSVKTEMSRLANAFPGVKFVSVVIDLSVVKVNIDWS